MIFERKYIRLWIVIIISIVTMDYGLNFGKKEKKNGIEVIDKFDENGNSAGTRTTLYLKINEN